MQLTRPMISLMVPSLLAYKNTTRSQAVGAAMHQPSPMNSQFTALYATISYSCEDEPRGQLPMPHQARKPCATQEVCYAVRTQAHSRSMVAGAGTLGVRSGMGRLPSSDRSARLLHNWVT